MFGGRSTECHRIVIAELATFALTLINKTLFGIPDKDIYNHTNHIEELGMESMSFKDDGGEMLVQQIQL